MEMEFYQNDNINYVNKDNLDNNISCNEEKSTKSIPIDKLKKGMAMTEMDENEQYSNEIERYQTIRAQKEHNYFSIDVTHNSFSEQNLESIEDSRLVSSIQESVFGPDYFARIYWKEVEEYLQNGGDPDEFGK